ncbi:MAG: ABC transporter ATP-binding protein [Verrucomicrobiales bacterium]|nr:ABC transporter ATP-binding protein [Verrucomicrobiales bacterium]
MSEELAIRTIDLRVDYGETVAVKSLNLEVPRGEIYGLVGPNGAGKTSTFRILSTLMEPTYGEVFLCGIDALLYPADVRHRLAYMPDLAPVPSDLRCGEFLEMFAAAHGLRGKEKRDRVEECLEIAELTEKRNSMCRTLSRGMTQRLVLAKSLLHKPDVLILDEPASGLDPVRRAGLRNALRDIAKDGRTVIISSHILTELADMCTSVGLMRRGLLVDSGRVDDVVDRMGQKQKRITIRFFEGLEGAKRFLDAKETASGVEIQPGGDALQFSFSGGNEQQSELIAELIRNGCKLRTFQEQQSTIEEIFLELSGDDEGGQEAE